MSDRVSSTEQISWSFFEVEPYLLSFLNSKSVTRNILLSRAFRRLADIRFLGAIDYLLNPTGGNSKVKRHTRQQHTYGVARLAMLYAEKHELNERESALLCSAALLHDIGHAPLSHSIESLFFKHFGIDHHKAGKRIIRGLDRAGLGQEISSALYQAKIDPEEVICLIDGRHVNREINILFSHPINIDTIEAIIRCKYYASISPQTHSPRNILFDLTEKNSKGALMDDFWQLKDAIYTVFINGGLGVYADRLAQEYFIKNFDSLSYADFFRSERAFRSRHPDLFKLFKMARMHLKKDSAYFAEIEQNTTQFTKRHFFIDPLYAVGIPARYIQNKSSHTLSVKQLERSARIEMAEIDKILQLL